MYIVLHTITLSNTLVLLDQTTSIINIVHLHTSKLVVEDIGDDSLSLTYFLMKFCFGELTEYDSVNLWCLGDRLVME
ncbi:hypothetical protein Hanom_Chr15g01346691 [Helianthus anomalus]